LASNDTHLLRLDNKLYHEQYFEDGSLCELSNKPRRTTIKLFCDEMTANHIESINEIETCVYEIRVHTSSLCLIKNFNKKFQNLVVKCSPVLNAHDYEVYSTQNVPLQSYNSEISDNRGDLLIKQLSDDLFNNEEKIKHLKEKTQFYENLLTKSVVDDGDVNLSDEIKNTENELMKSADNLLKTNDMLKKLSDKLNDIIESLDINNENLVSFDEFGNGNEVKNLDEIDFNEVETTAPLDSTKPTTASPMKIKVSVIDASSNIAEQLKKLNENEEAGSKVKNLENSIKEKLLMKNKKFENIDVKIINIDEVNANNNNDDLSSSLVNKLFNSLFGDVDNKNKISKINKNYNRVYTNGKFVDNSGEDDEDSELVIRY
jgi:hypothetical protein